MVFTGQACSYLHTQHTITPVISMRVAMELAYVIRNSSLKLGQFNMDGTSGIVLAKAKELRSKVISWFASGMDVQVEGMGDCLDLKENKIPLTRKRVILMDLMEKRISEEPKTEEEEDAMAARYLKDLSGFRVIGSSEVWPAWGGTPELVAFAHMSKRPIRVYRKTATGLELFQEFTCPDSDDSVVVNLLHEGSRLGSQATHYSTLVTKAEVDALEQRYGKLHILQNV